MVWGTIEPEGVEQDPRDHGGAHAGDHGGANAWSHGGPHAGDQTRARILEVALELIGDHGFAATTTREIAERLGFSKAALYYHFHTKDELLAAIVDTAMADLHALVDDAQGASTPEARRDLVAGYVQLVGTHADLIRVLSSDPSVKERAAVHGAMPVFHRLVSLLAGTDDPDAAQRTRVRAALTAVHGALVYAQPGDDPEVNRTAAFDAACAVLGFPASQSSESERSAR
ncbi:MAG: TetR/AcrR family transcriptional regulator [Acidimicrobiales bacterium]